MMFVDFAVVRDRHRHDLAWAERERLAAQAPRRVRPPWRLRLASRLRAFAAALEHERRVPRMS